MYQSCQWFWGRIILADTYSALVWTGLTALYPVGIYYEFHCGNGKDEHEYFSAVAANGPFIPVSLFMSSGKTG